MSCGRGWDGADAWALTEALACLDVSQKRVAAHKPGGHASCWQQQLLVALCRCPAEALVRSAARGESLQRWRATTHLIIDEASVLP